MAPIRFGLVGGGWRAEFFTRIARELPAQFQLAGVVQRDPAKAEAFAAAWGAPAYPDIAALAAAKPDFVVLSVKAAAHVPLLTELHQHGLAVLCETPAALTLEEMIAIWHLVEAGFRLQVAEQYLFQPLHAARLKLIGDGALGRVSFARVSTAHGYHGVSLMRQFLGLGFEDATIRGKRFESRALAGPDRYSWPAEESFAETVQLLGEFDFGDRLGLFDFTDVQYRSPVHSHRVVIRGERGEIADLELRAMPTYGQPVIRTFTRQQSGQYGNLGGHALETISCGDDVVWQMPFPGARLMDDEIAIAVAMQRMDAYLKGKDAGPYSFAEAAQDQYLALLMEQAARSGETLHSSRQPWAQ
ncbi:Gfo/Idh/MocA family protein [Devosia sp.]|uniref:Gfo/Idh/MocA family protein n=1 Tax=Devosia sp. TaxID=1871048 RepID=UPI003A8F1E33